MKITIPQKQSEITLGQFQDYIKVTDVKANENTFFLKQKVVEIFCKIPLSVVNTMQKKDVDSIYSDISKVLETETSTFKNRFTIGKTEFGFIPNFEMMTAAEYIDLSEYIHDWSNIHRAVAVLYRPVTLKKRNKWLKVNQYLIQKYNGTDEYCELMKQMPLDKVLSGIFFLISSWRELVLNLKVYLAEEVASHPQLKQTSLNNMDGLEQSMDLVAEMFLNGRRF